MKGKCSAIPGVVHQYALDAELDPPGSSALSARHYDIINLSCLNGWTCGNIVGSVGDISRWWWDIFHFRLVNESTVTEMLNGVR
jgi:hypothetical protein